MSNFDISELHKNREGRIHRRAFTYQEVLNKCYQRIRFINDTSYETYCYYIIPNLLFGLPLYDKNECIKFVFDNLIKNGFKVLYLHPNVFYISWEIIPEKKKDEDVIKKIEMKKENKIKSVSEYAPTGNFIYSNNTLSSLKNKFDN